MEIMNNNIKNEITLFSEDEVKHRQVYQQNNENVDLIINKHEKCLEILDAIKEFKNRKESLIDLINGYAGLFPSLRNKYVNRIDTINMCINRMYSLYEKMFLS